MRYLVKAGQVFFALALLVYGAQQFYFGSFRDVFFSPYREQLPLHRLLAYAFGAFLITSGFLILTRKKGRAVSLITGFVFLLLFISTHLTYELISEPNKIYHLGLWAIPLKELALAGGAFVVAGSFPHDTRVPKALNAFIPYGNLCFLTTMFCFGLGHCMYAQYLTSTVPAWVPDHIFWVYFTGCALMAAATAIYLGIRIRVVALLLALMIFLWFWMVHVPGAIANPVRDRGNLPASAFDALAYSGTALLIAFTMQKQKWIEDIENWK